MRFGIFGLFALISLSSLSSIQAVDGYPVGYVGNGAIANDEGDCCTGFSIEGDYLYWQPSPQAVGTLQVTTSNGVSNETRITAKDIKTKYFPGYRVGLFYQDQCVCWKLGLIWTHIDSNTRSSFVAPEGGQALFSNTQLASAKLDKKVDYLDFDVAVRARILSCFIITPHIGIRGYRESDELIINASGSIPASPFNSVINDKTNTISKSCGIEGGIWMEWNLSCGLSFIGHFGGSIMLTDTKSKTNGTIVETDSGGTVLVNSTTRFRAHQKARGLGMANYFIGAQYTFDLCDLELTLRAGWEHFGIIVNNFEFEGLTAGLTIGF